MKEGTDYVFIPAKDKEDKKLHVKLLTGNYAGVSFKYGAMKFEERNEEEMHLLFNYDVIHSDSKKLGNIKALNKNEDFKNHIGNLLVELLSRQFEQDVEIYEDENEIGADDLKGIDI
jgi:hypothetical protein